MEEEIPRTDKLATTAGHSAAASTAVAAAVGAEAVTNQGGGVDVVTPHGQLEAVANINRQQKLFVDQVIVSMREVKQRITNTDHSQQALVKHVQLVILQELQKINSNLCRQVSCLVGCVCLAFKYLSY